MKLKFLAAFGLAATLYSCDDTTTGVGVGRIGSHSFECGHTYSGGSGYYLCHYKPTSNPIF